jgi:hypothetical protein
MALGVAALVLRTRRKREATATLGLVPILALFTAFIALGGYPCY